MAPVSPTGVDVLNQTSALASDGCELFVSSTQGRLAALTLNPDTLGFTPRVEINVNLAYQTLSPFLLGGQPHLLAYTRDEGILDFSESLTLISSTFIAINVPMAIPLRASPLFMLLVIAISACLWVTTPIPEPVGSMVFKCHPRPR